MVDRPSHRSSAASQMELSDRALVIWLAVFIKFIKPCMAAVLKCAPPRIWQSTKQCNGILHNGGSIRENRADERVSRAMPAVRVVIGQWLQACLSRACQLQVYFFV